jgi:DNA-binding NtrC family response regulator
LTSWSRHLCPANADLLAHFKQVRPEAGHHDRVCDQTAVLAIKRGAYDYLTKPFTTQDLLVKLERLFASHEGPEERGDIAVFGRLMARSQIMKRLFEQVRCVAPTDRTILLCGESGTGKELFAEAIHATSPRAAKPLVRFSCAALQPSVLESELFGRRRRLRGPSGRGGRFRPTAARCSTSGRYLTELQVKLRVVEQQKLSRVGGERRAGRCAAHL